MSTSANPNGQLRSAIRRSKEQLQPDLHLTWRIRLGADDPELVRVARRVRIAELHRVAQVECLATELGFQLFMNTKSLEECEIQISDSWSADVREGSAGIAEREGRRLREHRCIKILAQFVFHAARNI